MEPQVLQLRNELLHMENSTLFLQSLLQQQSQAVQELKQCNGQAYELVDIYKEKYTRLLAEVEEDSGREEEVMAKKRRVSNDLLSAYERGRSTMELTPPSRNRSLELPQVEDF